MENKKKYLIKYITESQARSLADQRDYLKPKQITIEAETERAAQYTLWTSKKGPLIDRIISIKEISEEQPVSPALQYKIGWYNKNERRCYKTVETKEEAIDLIAALLDYPGQISVKQVTPFKLRQ